MAPPASPDPRAQDRFDRVVAEYADFPGAQLGGGKRVTGRLMIAGKIVAMLDQGRLVVKLPADRVTALVERGHADRWATKPGQPLREWAIAPAASASAPSVGESGAQVSAAASQAEVPAKSTQADATVADAAEGADWGALVREAYTFVVGPG